MSQLVSSQSMSSWLDVKIDFDQSHLFFPHIIIGLLIMMAVLIMALEGRRFMSRLKLGDVSFSLFQPGADKMRFFGTLILIVVYFWSMDAVGQLFPNMGMGFLLTSIPFILMMSLLYVHKFNRRKLLSIVLNAVIAPLVVWYVLGQWFAITLP
ncbi:tripartite tricarboxylate transporter [Terasakiispira papahanaumokuakeensis]|uniref:Tripartite tricarboxylate transporter n=1 Tax=Terasakiispira papahanaumokuakeensis TaxID=197479 RepID=A0A1E2VE01_9GAMM|nr:tripartite tricarboxylate transporter TctB family protein [Terasakiispira papahanaumokuakeensis]ODC05207.1 tripartite tricarboxylate transporter [Terasakiispira papahanaumokuakeensis]